MGPPRLRRMVRDQPGCFSSHLVDRRQAVLADHDAVPDVRNHPVGRTAEPGAMYFGAKPEVSLPLPTYLTGSLSQFPRLFMCRIGNNRFAVTHWQPLGLHDSEARHEQIPDLLQRMALT